MRYIYDIFRLSPATKQNRVRVATETRLENVFKFLEDCQENTWEVTMHDNLRNTSRTMASIEELEMFAETIARYVWADASQKEADKAKLLEALGSQMAMKWDPFNEQESGIHKKGSTPEEPKAPIDDNVKTAAAMGKPRISAVPAHALFELGAAMQNGADKYGLFNWRGTSVTATVFYDAIMRHLTLWYEGEDIATDSGCNHLAHVMANCAILLDAEKHNVFNDNRYKKVKSCT